MRVLFLDIDGVLNSTRTCVAFGGYPHNFSQIGAFDRAAIKLLQRMCDSTGVQVVLSSAWRITHSAKEARDALGLPVIDVTPNLGAKRGNEIAAWLADHPEVTDYAIVDDDSDMLPGQMHRFIHTSGHEGLTWDCFSRLCGLFGASPYEGEPRDRNWRQAAGGWA